MILKKRSKPLVLQRLEAIIPRLQPSFPRLHDIKQDIANRYKGYIGEQKVDFHLDQLPGNYTILHDVYLKPRNSQSFQIDSLVITNQSIFIIETKNFSGTITFHPILRQFTRNNNMNEEGYRYPITQAENTQQKLTHWLHDQHLHDISVHYLIAISDPSTIVKVIGDEQAIASKVAHAEHIPQKIIAHNEEVSGKRWTSRKIGEIILSHCETYDFNILDKYGIKQAHLKTGVFCPGCKQLGMTRGHGMWICRYCTHRSRKAHLKALSDYFLLGNSWITNQACQRFLHLPTKSMTTRILKASGLSYQQKHKRWSKRMQ